MIRPIETSTQSARRNGSTSQSLFPRYRNTSEPWREGLLELGLPVHLVNHLATMADLHRAGRYDRMSDDVLTLTGQGPLSLQEFVRKNAAKFTAAATAA